MDDVNESIVSPNELAGVMHDNLVRQFESMVSVRAELLVAHDKNVVEHESMDDVIDNN